MARGHAGPSGPAAHQHVHDDAPTPADETMFAFDDDAFAVPPNSLGLLAYLDCDNDNPRPSRPKQPPRLASFSAPTKLRPLETAGWHGLRTQSSSPPLPSASHTLDSPRSFRTDSKVSPSVSRCSDSVPGSIYSANTSPSPSRDRSPASFAPSEASKSLIKFRASEEDGHHRRRSLPTTLDTFSGAVQSTALARGDATVNSSMMASLGWLRHSPVPNIEWQDVSRVNVGFTPMEPRHSAVGRFFMDLCGAEKQWTGGRRSSVPVQSARRSRVILYSPSATPFVKVTLVNGAYFVVDPTGLSAEQIMPAILSSSNLLHASHPM